MSREIVIDSENFRHVVKAVANYRTGRDRLESTVLTLADHIRNGRRHQGDCLAAGEVSKWNADDAMFMELITQVLVAAQIVLEQKEDIKWKMVADAENEARKEAIDKFERVKATLVRQSTADWLDFEDFKREQEKKRKEKIEKLERSARK